MGLAGSITIESIAAGILVAATASIIARWWQRRREAVDDAEQWYQDALSLIARLQQTGHRTTAFQQADYPTLYEKLDPLADELQGHAGGAPDGVAEEARHELVLLGGFASALINLTEQSEDIDAIEFFKRVQDHAREMYDGEHDIKDVNQIIEPLDVDALAERQDADVETDDEAIEDFLSVFSEESLEAEQPMSIDEALEMPIDILPETVADESAWDELLGDTMREYVHLILVNVAGDVFEAMEKRKASL